MVDEEFTAYSIDMLRSVDTLLFGRITYELMARYWPAAPVDDVAEKMNQLPKVVVSRTLRTVVWSNSMLLAGYLAAGVYTLKAAPGKDIALLGSASVANTLLQLGLIDEYRVILSPVLLGRGHPLFSVNHLFPLRLEKATPLRSGVVILTYHKA
jgi:dihydrofolate reductase